MLRNAEVKAINSILPAVNGKYLDMVARKIINEAGLGAYFQHSLGHGIGLAEHENPVITFRKDDQIVPEDSVIAIEPGVLIYLVNLVCALKTTSLLRLMVPCG